MENTSTNQPEIIVLAQVAFSIHFLSKISSNIIKDNIGLAESLVSSRSCMSKKSAVLRDRIPSPLLRSHQDTEAKVSEFLTPIHH